MEAIFSHIPGLKVVSPSNAYDAKGLLSASVEDKNPVIFLEHRWLHNTSSYVPKKYYTNKIGKGKIIKRGKDATIIAFSYGVILAIEANKILEKYNINLEIIDLISLRPLDKNLIINSIKKTRKVLVIDNGLLKYGVSSEIITLITENIYKALLKPPLRIGIDDNIIPSSSSISHLCYPSIITVIEKNSRIVRY